MMWYVVLIICLLVCVYWGQVLGLMIQCDNCTVLNEGKKYVYMIPFLRVIMFISFLYDSICNKEWKRFLMYAFYSGKNVMLLCAIIDLLPELQRIRRKQEMKKRINCCSLVSLKMFASDVQSVLDNVLNCRYQFNSFH